MVRVRRKDNTKALMRGLKKASQKALTEAAQKLMLISKQAVSRKYTRKPGRGKG